MKKTIAKLMALVMVAGAILTGCGSEGGNDSSSSSSYAPADAVTMLEEVWAAYGEDEKFFAMGGDMNNIVDNAPGAYDVADAEGIDAVLGYPQASVGMIDSAASLVHAMNANTFTAGAYNVTETDEVEMLISDIEDNISNRQWMCGFPDTLIIVKVGSNMVVTAFGEAQNIENFKTKLVEVYEGAEVSVEKDLTR